MAFYIGQKVVFTGDGPTFHDQWGPKCALKIGSVYTIREIDPVYIPFRGFPGIRIEEIRYNPVPWNGIWFEPATLAPNFKPAVERKTDISIFTAMLATNRQSVDA